MEIIGSIAIIIEIRLPIPSPPGGCVVIKMEGGFPRNPAVAGSGSSALECGRSKVWVIGLQFLRTGCSAAYRFLGFNVSRWKNLPHLCLVVSYFSGLGHHVHSPGDQSLVGLAKGPTGSQRKKVYDGVRGF